MYLPHTPNSYCKTNKELYNCAPGRFAILCSSNMQQNNNPRLFCWISRSGHFACHSTIHALHVNLIKPEWFWLHVPKFWLKALKKHLLGSYQHRRCKAQSCIWEAISFARGQGIHTEQKRKIILLNLHLNKSRYTNQTEINRIACNLLPHLSFYSAAAEEHKYLEILLIPMCTKSRDIKPFILTSSSILNAWE